MARAIAVLSTSTAALLHDPFGPFAQRLAGFWRSLSHEAVGPYRPERHYMRGPGPAWHAKHGEKPQ